MGGGSDTVHRDSIYYVRWILNQSCAKISPSYLAAFMAWTSLSSALSSVQVEERTKASKYRIRCSFPIVNVVSVTNVNIFIVGAHSISDLADYPYLTLNSDPFPSGFRWDHNTEFLKFIMFKLL